MQIHFTEAEPKNTYKGFFDRAKDIYHQDAFSTINDTSSKLRTYGLIKEGIGREDYLLKIRNTKLRSKLSKFRLSNHKLRIEVGRHENLQSHERICQICLEDIEDEIHFLVKCKHYANLRQPLFNDCINLRPQFCYYTDKEKFIFIMASPSIMGNVSKFLDNALSDRDTHLEVIRVL